VLLLNDIQCVLRGKEKKNPLKPNVTIEINSDEMCQPENQ